MTTYSIQDIIKNRKINLTCPECKHTVSIPYQILINCDIFPVCSLCSSELPKFEANELKKNLECISRFT